MGEGKRRQMRREEYERLLKGHASEIRKVIDAGRLNPKNCQEDPCRFPSK